MKYIKDYFVCWQKLRILRSLVLELFRCLKPTLRSFEWTWHSKVGTCAWEEILPGGRLTCIFPTSKPEFFLSESVEGVIFKFRLSSWIFHWSSWSSCTVSELRRDVEPFSSHCFDASSTETRMKMTSGMKWNGWANCKWLLEWIFQGFSWRLLTTLTKQTS